jgi:hypothetical protein
MKVSNVGSIARVSLVASLSVAGSAFAILPEEPVTGVVREDASLPAPGERLVRVAAKPTALESASTTAAFGNASIERDTLDGSFRLASGRLGLSMVGVTRDSRAARRNADSLIRSWVGDRTAALGVSASSLRFNAAKFFADDKHVFVSYDVVLDGVSVKGTSVDFRFANGELVQVAARTFGAGTSKAARAAARAARSSQSGAELDAKSARRVLGPQAGIAKASEALVHVEVASDGLSYAFKPARQLEATSATGELFSIVTEVGTERVLQWNSLHLKISSTVQGVVNNRSVNDGTSTLGLPRVQGTYGSGGWFGNRRTVTADAKGRLEAPNGVRSLTVTLSSPVVQVAHSSGKSAALELISDARGGLLFDAERNSTLAENTTFYHITVARDWAKGYISAPWFDKPVTANVNIADSCNAFWNGRSVNFFNAGGKRGRDGTIRDCNNTGEIADVVYHEWGHGLDNNTGGIDDGAYSEGIGDIVSMLITDSNLVGPGFFADGKPVRDLEGEYSYPKDKGEVHKEGLIIGSTWWHMTGALKEKYGADVGRQTASRWFLKSLYTTSQYTDSYQALLVLDAEDGEPGEGPNFCLINTAFARHGLAKAEERCVR